MSEPTTAERMKEILARQEAGEDEHYSDATDSRPERKKPGRKPAPTTEELECELYEINLAVREKTARAIEIRAILKGKY